jgi:hypothetical protein
LGLALLDLGRTEEARTELARVLETVPDHDLAARALGRAASHDDSAIEERGGTPGLLGDLAEEELENAFQDAEAQPDEMMSASRVVAATVRAVDHDKPEGVILLGENSPFATQTVAGLLEQQDHREEAEAIRDVLEDPAVPASLATDPGEAPSDTANGRAGVIATLERWLENLQRGCR